MQSYTNNVQDRQGNAIAGAQVLVLKDGATAVIYSDNGITPATNPLTTDANGSFTFYGPTGNYSLIITSPKLPGPVEYVGIPVLDPDDFDFTLRDDLASDRSGKGAALVGFIQTGVGAVNRSVQDKTRESVSVNDFASPADAIANIPLLGKIVVPNGGAATPISGAGKNILWEYDQGGDSDNVLDADGNRGGFFADYDCKAGKVLVYQVRENQSAIAGGGFRDLLFLNTVDNDTTNYTAVGQKCTYGVRSYVQGAYVSGAYQSQYKDLVGGEFYAIGNIQWDDRGCSGITAAAVQYGSGIASNEFSVQNPSSGAAGGIEQSRSMAAIQPIIRAQFADEDATHLVRGVLVTNLGRRATAGVEILSSTAEGYSGHYKYGLQMAAAVVTDSAIHMPQSASGNVGTIIVYDPNDYSIFDRSENRFSWVVGGSVPLSLTATGVGVGLQISNAAQTRLQINASTSALSHLQLVAGATPTLPNNGEIWFDGAAVKIVIGGVVKTFTVV